MSGLVVWHCREDTRLRVWTELNGGVRGNDSVVWYRASIGPALEEVESVSDGRAGEVVVVCVNVSLVRRPTEAKVVATAGPH